jgi:3-methyladenine DNA glycosylase AlkC
MAVAVIAKIQDIKELVGRGRVEPEAVFPELRRLAASDQWQTREVAATALVEIGKRHPAAVLQSASRWAKDCDANVRRAASEGLRGMVKVDPGAVRPVLETLRADPELYVKKSVANVLRNASRKHPDFVLGVCREWVCSTNAHTRWIVKDGLRKLKGLRPRDVAVILGM